MRRPLVATVGGALLALLAGTALPAAFETLPPDPGYPLIRHVRYAFVIRNETDRVVPRAEFWAFAPVKQTATQRCLRLETSHPCERSVDGAGNQLLHFTLDELPPRGSRRIWVAADLGLSRRSRQLPEGDFSACLVPEPQIQAAHPEIVALAESLRAGTAATSASRIFHWVAGNLRYAGYLREDRGALFALRTRSGDCTEYSSLFVALCRAVGIPARAVAGYLCGENALLKAGEFHQWAEFHAEGAWNLADPQRRALLEAQQDYLAVRVFGRSTVNAGGRHRFWASPEGVSARME